MNNKMLFIINCIISLIIVLSNNKYINTSTEQLLNVFFIYNVILLFTEFKYFKENILFLFIIIMLHLTAFVYGALPLMYGLDVIIGSLLFINYLDINDHCKTIREYGWAK